MVASLGGKLTVSVDGFNGSHFNTRTRALNNVLYWLAQVR